jgi:hypothetical protein
MVNGDDTKKGNLAKLAQLRQVFETMPPKVLRPGFFGMLRVKVKIQDGVIQDIVSKVVESMK